MTSRLTPGFEMAILFLIFYNIIVLPLLALAAHVAAMFSKKIRRGVLGRYQSLRKIRAFRQLFPSDTKMFLVHCASMGEFEHTRPVLQKLKEAFPESKTIVMFFSPSGYENRQETPGVDLFIYTPFDWAFTMRRLFRAVNPAALLIARYDVWPGQVIQAQFSGIPAILVNASIYKKSSRLTPWLLGIQRLIYRHLSAVLAISTEDGQRFALLISAEKISVTGDTKYEQVLARRDEITKDPLVPEKVSANKVVFVAGSSWSEGEAHFIPALKAHAGNKFLTLICPHEPTEEHLFHLQQQLSPLKSIRLSEIDSYYDEQIILIDRIGILANLYKLADFAYVGGGFKQNVHNVLEPAAYAIPVLFGPNNENSREAQLLKASGGGIEVLGQTAFDKAFEILIGNKEVRVEKGIAAFSIIEKNLGASGNTINAIQLRLKEN
ncbi:MAG: 3-deoxy-D-manno-octulosonic acid transferase [Calditrichia bacterium]